MATIRENLINPGYYEATLYKSVQWLQREILQIKNPIQAQTFSLQALEVIEKVARLVFLVLAPLALVLVIARSACSSRGHSVPFSEPPPPSSDTQEAPIVQANTLSQEIISQLDELKKECMSVFNAPKNQSSLEKDFLQRFDVLEKEIAQSAPQYSEIENLKNQFEIAIQVEQLRKKCEDILNLDKFSGLEALAPQFLEMKMKINIHAKVDHFKCIVAFFKDLEEQFQALIKNKFRLIHAPIRMKDNGQIPIPDKGNCFFEAASIAYKLYVSQASAMDTSLTYSEIDPKKLRQEIIQWERSHFATDYLLQGLVDAAIDVFVQDKQEEIRQKNSTIQTIKGEDTTSIKNEIATLKQEIDPYLNESTKIEHYFNQASKDGFWAGLSEVYAFAKIYNVGVWVREENKLEIDYMRFNEEATQSMTIWWVNGCHFEVRIKNA